jgi:intracellular sulfur oxidation DsrE/DsrF family protein
MMKRGVPGHSVRLIIPKQKFGEDEMLKTLRSVILGGLVLLASTVGAMAQEDGVHHLALQISDNDPQKMNTVLNVAANVASYYSGIGEEVEIRVVAFNAGLHMLRDDTSPVLERLGSFEQSMPNVTFAACGNTIDGMARREGKEIPIVGNATRVHAGVVELMTLEENGWTIIRP